MFLADFLAQIKQRLLDEQKRLELDLADISNRDPKHAGEYTPEYPESGGNSDDDNAAEVTNLADEISIVAKLEKELRDTVKALDALEKETYGACKYCGKDIDIKRLEARPTSSTCITCKKMLTQEL